MHRDSIVCPFCPLHCDDLTVGGSGESVEPECTYAAEQFSAVLRPTDLRIGRDVHRSFDADTFRAALSLSKTPLVEIHGATIEESKAMESWVAGGLVRVRSGGSAGVAAMDQAIARDGMMAATLADVCRHSDFIWIIGDVDAETPRLRDRLERTGAELHHTPTLSLQRLSELQQRVGRIDASAGRSEKPGDADEASVEAERVFRRIRRSRYVTIVLGDEAFESGHEVAGCEGLNRFIARWNESAVPIGDAGMEDEARCSSRIVLLRFTPDPNLRGVLWWRNNEIRSGWSNVTGPVEVRLGARPQGHPAPVQLQIGGRDPGVELAHAFIPAGTPGVGAPGMTIRGDGSVTLPLSAWAECNVPMRMHVLRDLLG